MFKKLAALLLALMMLPIFALAEEGCVINLIDNPEAEFAFEEGKDIFTIVYPNVTGSDAAILQYQDEVWMIDCSTDDQSPKFVVPALEDLGITHIDVAFNSHPHDDHITGFEFLDKQATIGKLIVAFDRNHNYTIQRNNVPGISTWYGIVRFRTDGNIWVVDRLPTRVQNGKNKK